MELTAQQLRALVDLIAESFSSKEEESGPAHRLALFLRRQYPRSIWGYLPDPSVGLNPLAQHAAELLHRRGRIDAHLLELLAANRPEIEPRVRQLAEQIGLPLRDEIPRFDLGQTVMHPWGAFAGLALLAIVASALRNPTGVQIGALTALVALGLGVVLATGVAPEHLDRVSEWLRKRGDTLAHAGKDDILGATEPFLVWAYGRERGDGVTTWRSILATATGGMIAVLVLRYHWTRVPIPDSGYPSDLLLAGVVVALVALAVNAILHFASAITTRGLVRWARRLRGNRGSLALPVAILLEVAALSMFVSLPAYTSRGAMCSVPSIEAHHCPRQVTGYFQSPKVFVQMAARLPCELTGVQAPVCTASLDPPHPEGGSLQEDAFSAIVLVTAATTCLPPAGVFGFLFLALLAVPGQGALYRTPGRLLISMGQADRNDLQFAYAVLAAVAAFVVGIT